MSNFGVTDQGYVGKSYDECASELQGDLSGAFGANLNFGSSSVIGQMTAIVADRESSVWDMGEGVYAAGVPDTASGVALRDVCAITGTTEEPVSAGSVAAQCIGNLGTQIPAGVIFADSTNPQSQWATLLNPDGSTPTLEAPDAWVTDTDYVDGEYATSDAGVWLVTVPGVSGPNAPTGSTPYMTFNDGPGNVGGVGWTLIPVSSVTYPSGFGVAQVPCQCTQDGAVALNAGALTSIVTPVAGLLSVTNLAAATPGNGVETDAALRLQREAELAGSGTDTAAAIKSAVELALGPLGEPVANTVPVNVLFNDSDYPDRSSAVVTLPPHSVEVVIDLQPSQLAQPSQTSPGLTVGQAIAAAIWNVVAGGIQTVGTSTFGITDSQGNAQQVSFSTVTQIPIYVLLCIQMLKSASWTPAAIAGLLATNLVLFADDTWTPDDEVFSSQLAAQCFSTPYGSASPSSTGVQNVARCLVSASAAPATNWGGYSVVMPDRHDQPLLQVPQVLVAAPWQGQAACVSGGDGVAPSFILVGKNVWYCTTAGTSGATMPSFPTNPTAGVTTVTETIGVVWTSFTTLS